MKNGRFEPKDKSFSKRDKEASEVDNCSDSSLVTLIFFRPHGLASLEVTLGNIFDKMCHINKQQQQYIEQVQF